MRALRLVAILLASWCSVGFMRASDLQVPEHVVAGNGLSIHTSGQGEARFYLLGPSSVVKRQVKLGEEIAISPEETQTAGRYLAILDAGGEKKERAFWIKSAQAARLNFLARPSRLPVALSGAISGVVYVFDIHDNVVLEPRPIKFELSVAGVPAETRTVVTKNGVAWTRASSGRKAGAAQFVASHGEVSEKRVVQLVASDPCNLRMQAARVKESLEITTAPIRDCSGNPVPDGTIVTFTAITPRGKSTVDARIKRGFATAKFPLTGPAQISVASGVVMGNEVNAGGGQ